ncbi:MAG: spermidine/putrescine ABC transporter substrate-binding protein [Bacillota bacterium]
MVRRKVPIFPVLAVLLALALTASCGGAQQPPAAKPETPTTPEPQLSDTLNVFNWTEYLPQEAIDKFQEEFHVKVNYDTYSSNEEMLAKLQAGASGYDLVVPSDYMIEVMIKQGLLEKIDLKNIPNFKNLGKQFVNLYYDPGNQYSVPYMWGTDAIAYNTKHVKKAITSWNDLLDSRYKGKIVAVDDSRVIPGIALKALGYSVNETDPAKLQEAKEWLKKFVPQVKAWDSDSPKTLLISEEAWIGAIWGGEAALAMNENPNITYVIPKEGGIIWQDNMAIPKGAPHKYTAEVFINFILRPEIAAMIAKAYPYGSPNEACWSLLPPEVRNNNASYPPSADLDRCEWSKDVGQATQLYDQIYTEVKSGK